MDLALNNLQWLICHKTKPNSLPRSMLSVMVIIVGKGIDNLGSNPGQGCLHFTSQ